MAKDKAIIRRHSKTADRIIELDKFYSQFSDEELKSKTVEFRELINNGAEIEDIIIDAYAVAREAAFRILKLKAYKVQLVGALILNSGDIVEMKTGEGKTLTGLLAAYVNALSGKGVHIVTVNEYLSQRDCELNGQVLTYLGLSVGLVRRDMGRSQKKEAYNADVTYVTNSEIGFDYLRDNMVNSLSDKTQRGFNYGIIDEADSVLIDEARTPLIISGGKQNRSNLYKMADEFAKTLIKEIDVDFDLETKQVFLADNGIKKAHTYFNMKELFDVKNTEIYHLIMNALKANFVFKKEVEYTVQGTEIVLIDQFTGRIMTGRSYSDGLHQALQAKEDVPVEDETVTLATITYQNFYRLYSKLSGMTGTAKTDEEEFLKIYNTRVVVCPTNKPIIRKDYPDYCFYSKDAKLKKLVIDIKKINEKGRPILIGTTSVESSEQISRYLDKAKLKYEMINAKNHGREAEIIEKAGQKYAITLATNMAGRGTDIKLTDETRELGGLIVIGVERNESRRVDNQLRGRSGRQGDAGSSVFYISMEDELMVRFAAPKLRAMFRKLGDDFIQSKLFSKSLTNAQKKLEGLNFDQRKNVLDYDNILSQHRETIYIERDEILKIENFIDLLSRFSYTIAYENLIRSSENFKGELTLNKEKYVTDVNKNFLLDNDLKLSIKEINNYDFSQIAEIVQLKMITQFERINENISEAAAAQIHRRTVLQALDKFWTKHINLCQKLRSGIYLQQYAQNNPLNQYIEESSHLFKKMKIDIAEEVITKLINSKFTSTQELSDIYVSAEKIEPNVIELKAEDILEEIGINKNDFNRENVLKKFEEYKTKFVNDKNKLIEVEAKEKAMIQLMDKLDKEVIEQNESIRKAVGIKQDKFNELLSYFNIKPEQFSREISTELINKKIEEVNKKGIKKEISKVLKYSKEIFEIMDKLDKLLRDKKSNVNLELTQEDINTLKNKYGLADVKTIHVEELRKVHLKHLEGVTNQKTIDNINMEFSILAGILCKDIKKEIEMLNKKNKTNKVVMIDKDGKVTKSIKVNDDGSLASDEMEDTEQIETRVKIG